MRTAPQGETARRGRPHSQMRKVGLVAKVMIAFDCSHFWGDAAEWSKVGHLTDVKTCYMRPQRSAQRSAPPGVSSVETRRL